MGFEVYTGARDTALRNGERAREEAEAQRQRDVMAQAGSALAQGDAKSARNAFYTGGMVDQGMALDRSQREQGRQTQEDAQTQRTRQMATVVSGATGLLHVAPDQRLETLNTRIAPVLRSVGIGDDVIGQISHGDLSDQSLTALLVSMGGNAPDPTENDRSGPNGSILRPDRQGNYAPVYAAPFDPLEGAPNGYRWTGPDRSAMEPVPGGSADPAVVARNAGARRAPPRARSGGNGPRSSGGGSAGPASTGVPSLPPGWTVRR